MERATATGHRVLKCHGIISVAGMAAVALVGSSWWASSRADDAADAPAMTAPATAPVTAPATAPAEAPATAPAALPDAPPATAKPKPDAQRLRKAEGLVGRALMIAEQNPSAAAVAVRSAAALLPRLEGGTRTVLTARWLRLAMTNVSRDDRLSAASSFFDVAAHEDPAYGAGVAAKMMDPAARATGYISLSQAVQVNNWQRADDYAVEAQRAARAESNPGLRALSLVFVAHLMAAVDPAARYEALTEAAAQVGHVPPGLQRDYLTAELVGAAAKFDLDEATRVAGGIGDPGVKNLALARINLSRASQTSLGQSSTDAVASLAKAAAHYDVRAIPILIQLPPQVEVLKALGSVLPPVYPTAHAQIEASLLERMWDYTAKAEPGVYRDQLQSRLARLMVLHDLWRGRSWGKRLTWKGGRMQVGAFIQQVAAARRDQLAGAGPLQDVAEHNANNAIASTSAMTPAARSEALLLIAGQLLG